jgi:methylglutamate dehydrogenase subunit C
MMRLSHGGRIDRTKTLHFTIDGTGYTGHPGDTLASALAANGVRLFGRSFKYHRRRGLLGAGIEEPNALVTVIEGGVREPNLPATLVELKNGLVAESQNRWPSLGFDIGAVNKLGSKVFGAGFYYKTFFGPFRSTKIWHFFEHVIRRAAGLGAAGNTPDLQKYERMNAFCDVLVIGGGQAGLEAALAAAKAGKRVTVAELAPVFGGRLNWTGDEAKREGLVAELASMAQVRLLARTMVWGHYDGNTFAAIENVASHRASAAGEPRHRHWVIRANQVVLATGATERPLVFAGNDKPGVMLADSMLRMAAEFGVAPGEAFGIFTNNDGAYQTAKALAAMGPRCVLIVDLRKEVNPDMRAIATGLKAELRTGHAVVATTGGAGVNGVHVAPVDAMGRVTGPEKLFAVNALGMSGGWNPLIGLAAQHGQRPGFDATLQAFMLPTLAPSWHAVGAVIGDGLPSASPVLMVQTKKPLDKAFIDFQHDVTDSDIDLAHREGFIAVEHLKRYTTLGMATDQGRTSNVAGIARMAELLGKTVGDTGTTRFRAPFSGVSLGSVAAERFGHIMPNRLTPMQDWHAAHGGDTYAAGLWHRPMAYTKSGETLEQAYVREARAVRHAAGLVDVSTLGKILVQGPDAATFLDRVYTNMMSTLPVMKARYGLMLREDGLLFDDGTAWRLSETEFLVTTTTANAGKVMEHLEYFLDCVWPDLKCVVTSVTDQWGGMALAGPKARDILAACVTGTAVDNSALPHMGIAHGIIANVNVMVARLSFSGERAYEIYAPSGHAQRVWDAVMTVGEPLGLVPYGLEALGTLRVEKGHVTGAEIDGRTTADDLGLGGMLSKKKPFIGSAMAFREGLVREGRLQLVGLKSLDGRALNGGAHVVENGELKEPSTSLGHVTAACFSPAVNAYVGLALVKDGRKRIGQNAYLADPLRGIHMPVAIVSPHMIDPDGSRMHG